MAKIYKCTEEPNVGLEIKISRVEPTHIQAVQSEMALPDQPTYFAQTITGSHEELLIDSVEVAEQVEGGLAKYELYLNKLKTAQRKQNAGITRVMYMEGCEFDLPNWEWEILDNYKGLTVPTHPILKKVFYLEHHLSAEDTVGLMTAIMEETGVGEEDIKKVEGVFRNAVRPDQSGPDAEGTTENAVEAQPSI